MELKLAYPFTAANGQRIAKLEIRRPKVKDIKAAQRISANAADQDIYLFARMCGITQEDMEELDMADFARVQQTFSDMRDAKPVGDDGAAGEMVPVPAQ